jgi:hypothetical protein
MNRQQCTSAKNTPMQQGLTFLQIFVRFNDQSKYVMTIRPPCANIPQRLLDHLKEATFYSPKDLEALSKNLKDCRRFVAKGEDEHTPHLCTLLDARLKVCEETLAELELNLSQLTPELSPKWDKLVSILRSLAGCNARSKVNKLKVLYKFSLTYI